MYGGSAFRWERRLVVLLCVGTGFDTPLVPRGYSTGGTVARSGNIGNYTDFSQLHRKHSV
ncbi:hypothetical protein GCM10009624_07850 [Gordonia sinesedis]